MKNISRLVINRLPVDVNQLDEFACGQLDRVCDFASNFVLFTLLPSQKNLMVFDSTWEKFIHTPFLYLEHFSSPCYILSNHSTFFINHSSIGIAVRLPVKTKDFLCLLNSGL